MLPHILDYIIDRALDLKLGRKKGFLCVILKRHTEELQNGTL